MARRTKTAMPAVVLLLGVAAGTMRAQEPPHEIKGVISDTAGRPIPNARVIVVGTSISASADSQGRYRLCEVRDAQVGLRAMYVGFNALQRDSVTLRDSVTTIDFQLRVSPAMAAPVGLTQGSVTTGGRRRLPRHDTVKSTLVVLPPTCHRP